MKLGDIEIVWLGHASFRIRYGELVVYIDPYVLPEGPEPADIILVTHEHFDHCAPDQIKKIKKSDTVIITTKGAASKCKGDVRIVSPGDTMEVKGVTVTATWAYNVGKHFHPRDLGVGFVVRIGGKSIYHAGDTDVIPEMKQLSGEGIDLALLPVGGTYTMDLDQAVEAVKLIRPKAVVPMHYNYLDGLDLSPGELGHFKEKVESLGVKCYILDPVVGR